MKKTPDSIEILHGVGLKGFFKRFIKNFKKTITNIVVILLVVPFIIAFIKYIKIIWNLFF